MGYIELENEYKKDTKADSIYRLTKNQTLVYDESFVHWLQDRIINLTLSL